MAVQLAPGPFPTAQSRELDPPASGSHIEFKSTWTIPESPETQSAGLTLAHSSLQNTEGPGPGEDSPWAKEDAVRLPLDRFREQPVRGQAPGADSLARLRQMHASAFEAYKRQIGQLEEAKGSYEEARALREQAEHDSEVERNSLQAEATEQSQDSVVAKLDASQLLKSKQQIGLQVEELRRLEEQLDQQLDALRRKHDYLTGAFELLKQKRQDLASKDQAMEERRKKVECSETDYAAKLEELHQQLARLERDNQQLQRQKRELGENSLVIRGEIAKLRKRAKRRRVLKRRIDARQLNPELKKREMKGVKQEYARDFQALMQRVTELEVIKRQNNENMRGLDALREEFESEQSRLNEKVMLLDKKEEVLRSKEKDYRFKERTCGCQGVQPLPGASLDFQSRVRRLTAATPLPSIGNFMLPGQVQLRSPYGPGPGPSFY